MNPYTIDPQMPYEEWYKKVTDPDDKSQIPDCRGYTKLTWNEAKEILKTSPTRTIERDAWMGCAKPFKWQERQIFYQDKWLNMGHTSLIDNVGIGFNMLEPPPTIEELLALKIVYGARLSNHSLLLITHMTDG